MAESLELQVQLAQDLLASLNNVISNSGIVSNSFEQQLEISKSFNDSLNIFAGRFQTMSNTVLETSQKMQEAFKNDIIPQQAKVGKEIEESSKSAQANAEAATTATQQVADSTNERTEHRNKQAGLSEQRIKSAKRHSYNSKRWAVTDVLFKGIAKLSEEATKTFNNLDIVKRAATSKGLTLLVDIPKLIVTGIFKVVGSVIGLTFNFFKLSLSLPFMVADRAVQIGNAFRQDIIVTIGNAYQATKEYSNANSNIGKGISKLHGTVIGALKTFENPRSLLVKLFGEGASGAAAFLTDVSKAINDMGPLAEIFGHQVTNSSESAEFLMVAMRGLGLTSKEISYYALDAGVHQENIFDRLERVKVTVSQAAKQHSVDTKQVSLGMQKLRTNIKDFGHLSDQNLANLVARMRQLNVGAEDLTGVFSKFTSFEDAAKTSAMLYQSFGMSTDALDLLTASDPGQIVENFRDAMFATGRDYQDLNRHEKQLMQTTTGMSDAMLKSLMTYQNMGLSYDEARQRIANDDPTKQQIEAIKKLSSSIKEIQRIMTFKSPFEAFVKGLAKNGAASDKVKSLAISLSKMYETIYLFGLNLDKAAIEAITRPVIMIVTKVDEVFKSKQFREMLSTGVGAISRITGFLSKKLGKSEATNNLTSVLEKVHALEKTKHKDSKKDQAKIKTKAGELLAGADQSVKRILRKKGILTDDDKFVKGVTLQAILSEIKTASMHMQSKDGKESLKKITGELSTYTDEVTSKYIFDKEFQDNTGIKGLINKTTEDFKKMFDQGGGLFMDIFLLGGKIMGAIIKGFTIAVSSLIYVICGSLDDFEKNNGLGATIAEVTGQNPTDSKKFNILEWLGITKKEKLDITQGLMDGLLELTTKYDKIFLLSGAALSIVGELMIGIVNIFMDAFALFLMKAASTDMGTQIGMLALLGSETVANMEARASGKMTTDMREVLSMHKKNIKSQSKKRQTSLAGKFYINLLSHFKKIYGSDIYGNQLSHLKGFDKNLTLNSAQFRGIMLGIAKIKFLESILSYKKFKKLKPRDRVAAESALSRKLKSENIDSKIKPPVMTTYSRRSAAATYGGLGGVLGAAGVNLVKEPTIFPTKSQLDDGSYGSDYKKLNTYVGDVLEQISTYAPASSKDSSEFLKSAGISIKDGTISNANNIFQNGGLKFIESNGQIISPDSMDELASLSDNTKSSLSQVFANAALAYQKASEVVVLNKKEKLVNKNAAAEDGLIDEVMSMLYETLEISVNRKINVVNNKLEVTA